MENGDTMMMSHCASIHLQAGRRKEVAKEGMPHQIFGLFFVTAATYPDTSQNEKEI